MKHRLLVSALCLIYASVAAAADDPATQSLPAAEEVVSRMAASDLHRQSSIDGYAGMRRYVLENRKLRKRAEMLVKVKGDADGTKHFEIVSEDGWKSANSHVLRKMLESESETSRPQVRATSKLNFTNYEFEILRVEVLAGRSRVRVERQTQNAAKNICSKARGRAKTMGCRVDSSPATDAYIRHKARTSYRCFMQKSKTKTPQYLSTRS